MMAIKMNRRTLITIVIAGIAIYSIVMMCQEKKVSKFEEAQGETEMSAAPTSEDYAPAVAQAAPVESVGTSGCDAGVGTGLASSLLPREMASQEDFGQFAPDEILKGQNFMDPRQQVGMPETVGGTLRNSNLQIRAEPPNPKQNYKWNNSTIVPDLMQRMKCA